MSTSLIYHGFGAIDYNYLKTEFRCGKIYFYIEKKPEYQYCADCKSRDVIKKGFVKREKKTVPIGGKAVTSRRTHEHRIIKKRFPRRKVLLNISFRAI